MPFYFSGDFWKKSAMVEGGIYSVVTAKTHILLLIRGGIWYEEHGIFFLVLRPL